MATITVTEQQTFGSPEPRPVGGYDLSTTAALALERAAELWRPYFVEGKSEQARDTLHEQVLAVAVFREEVLGMIAAGEVSDPVGFAKAALTQEVA